MSHPVWVCGLKPASRRRNLAAAIVTPCMGVWIETVAVVISEQERWVTPCMGVWIETLRSWLQREKMAGHTLYGCVD